MSFISIASLKTIAGVGSAVAVVGGGGTVGYLYKDSIIEYINSVTTATAVQHQYVVATVATEQSSVDVDLYISDKKSFKCSVVKDGSTYIDKECEIYKLNKEDNVDTLSFKDVSDSTKIRAKSNLAKDKRVIVKLSKSFKDKLVDNTVFQVLSTKDGITKITDLKLEFDLNRDQTHLDTSITESSLMMIKLSEAGDASKTNGDENNYSCEIGENPATSISCKVYQATEASGAYTNTLLKTLKVLTTSTTNPAKDSYLIVDLLEVKKSFFDLDNKEIVIKKGSDKVAKGLLDNLLIGKVSLEANGSMLFKLSDAETRNVVSVKENQQHIITKFASKHKAAPSTLSKDSIVCRFVEGDSIYEDETCSLYKMWGASDNHFALSTLIADSQKIDGSYTDLETDKYQVVKVAQGLIDKFNASSDEHKKIEIVQKDKRTKAFNYQLVTLEGKGLLTSGDASLQKLHSSLFVARVKTADTNIDSQSTPINETFKCTIDGVELDCNVYKFSADPAKGNKLAANDFTSVDKSITPSSDLAANKYVVVELTSAQKTFEELKNKVIELKKSDSTTYATLEFDQQVFGYLGNTSKVALPIAAKDVGFIVSKVDPSGVTLDTNNIDTKARCKLSGSEETAHIDNFDDSCRLIKFTTPSSSKTTTSLSELHGLTQENHSTFTFSSDNDGFYKLIFDANKLYNIDLANFGGKQIRVELQDTTGTKTFGLVKLEQYIESATVVKGKTNLLLGKVSAAAEQQEGTSSKCKFDEADTVGFGCSVYKNTETTSKTDKEKVTFGATASMGEAFVKDDFYAIKLDQPKDISELTGKSIIYFEQSGDEKTASKKVTFNVEALMGGSWETNKKLYFLS